MIRSIYIENTQKIKKSEKLYTHNNINFKMHQIKKRKMKLTGTWAMHGALRTWKQN